MKNKSQEKYNLISEYLQNIMKDYSRVSLAKELNLSDYLIYQMTTGKSMPSYDMLLNLCQMFEGNTVNISNFIESNPQLLFWYWDNVRPNSLPINKINLLFSKLLNEGNYNRTDVAERLGMPQSYLSKLEHGVVTINYPRFETLCLVLNLDCLDTLNSFTNFISPDEERKRFGRYIRDSRRKAGFSPYEISIKLKIVVKNYEKFEDGVKALSLNNYITLFKLLDIPYNEGITKAFNCGYIKSQSANLDYYLGGNEGCNALIGCDGDLATVLNTLFKYEYIEDVKLGVKYPAKNVYSLIVMFLSCDLNNDMFAKEQIYHYLVNINSNDNLAQHFVNYDMDKTTLGELVLKQKERFGHSHQSLCVKSGYSIGYSSSRIRNNYFVLPFIIPIYKMLNIPISVVLEYMSTKNSNRIGRIIKRKQFEDLINSHTSYKYLNLTISSKDLLIILKEIFSKGSEKTRYDNVKKLNIPFYEKYK